MDGACSTHERDECCIKNIWSETLEGSDNSEDVGIDGRIILEWILEK